MTVLDWRGLLSGIEALFAPSNEAGQSLTIGAELELIPLDSRTRCPVPIAREDGSGSLECIRAAARLGGWSEVPMAGDAPSWTRRAGGRVSFEPGGQIEFSSPVAATASELIRDLRCDGELLTRSFELEGMTLESLGIDPINDISEVALQLHRPRYERMTRYFDSLGPSGAKMMRQTASLQISVQNGSNPLDRWWLLNSLAPYVTAIFANSPAYADVPAGHRSYRAHLWRTLDNTRTGTPVDIVNPPAEYLRFALAAGAIMYPDGPPCRPFGAWMQTGAPTVEDWELHLSTLFPEVRPRGYFELRSADAIPLEYLAAPIAFVAGLTYDPESSARAARILGPPDDSLLQTAGRLALRDADIHSRSVQLVELALAGCESLGSAYLSSADLSTAADFFDRYTRRGLSPADDWT